MLIHWLWYALRTGMNNRDKLALLERFQTAEDIFNATASDYFRAGLQKNAAAALQDKDLSQAKQIMAECEEMGIGMVAFGDAQYPSRLKYIAEPPMVLYYKGKLPDFEKTATVGVVGTRKASAYGMTSAKRLGYQIGKCGGIVVSGMAYGIDSMAMSGALTAGAKVVGVLGCGADIVYPLSNRALFQDVERYGCILSEFPPGTPPAKWNFPRRNRIISGLSNGVLVVEAPEKSGALITARLAAEQGRDVFAVPGNIDMPSFVGSNRLLRDGAIMVSSGWDILSEYEALYPDKIRRDTAPVHQTAYPDEVAAAGADGEKPLPKVAQTTAVPGKKTHLKKKLEKKSIDKEPASAYSDVNKETPKLSEEEQKIVSALQNGERLVDDVIAETGLTTGKLLSSLTMLELKGVLRRLPGKRISLK